MAYTENKSIDGLTAITPTIDDLVVTMDQAEVGVAKSSTLLSIYNLFKTTYDTLYAKYLGDADFYKYSIVTSVASGNLTVALKNYEGNDPTATKPIKIQIGGVIRTISSALSITINAGTNWFNAGSSELATKEIDYFEYLFWYSTKSGGATVGYGISRIPSGNKFKDFVNSGTNEKGVLWGTSDGINNPALTDDFINIGSFNATLSAGGAYTWSIPATSVIINRPVYETRWLDWNPVTSGSGGMTVTITSISVSKYKLIGDVLYFSYCTVFTNGGTAGFDVYSSLPFTTNLTTPFCTVGCYDGTDFVGNGTLGGGNSFFVRKGGTTWQLGAGHNLGVNSFYKI